MDLLHGTIPDSCWEYSGQEHATQNQERQKFDKLLADSSRNLFDAVIVSDPSRWSRDPLRSAQGLNKLKENGIRFFIGTLEQDLFDPQADFVFDINMVVGKFTVRVQNLKSITNKIHRAKRGIPTAGNLPFGRTFNRKTEQWGIDEEKQKMIQAAAQRYLDDESMPSIAKSYGTTPANLWKTLKFKCGTEWPVNYCNEDVNVNETVVMTVPRLLDESVIAAVHEKSRANKTYNRGDVLKYNYLLGRMIFCSVCGRAMSGFTGPSGNRSYRHTGDPALSCRFMGLLSADAIEQAVLLQIGNTFGNPDRLNQAVKEAHPDTSKIEGLCQEQETLNNDLKRITSQKDRVVEKVSKELFTDEEAKAILDRLRLQVSGINDRLYIIENLLSSIPDPQRVDRLTRLAQWSSSVRSDVARHKPDFIFTQDYAYQRRLVESSFAGLDAEGKRLGVYMTKTEDTVTPWTFEIRGLVENTILSLPLTDDDLIDIFHLEPEYQDLEKELEKIKKLNIAGRDAYLRLSSDPRLRGGRLK